VRPCATQRFLPLRSAQACNWCHHSQNRSTVMRRVKQRNEHYDWRYESNASTSFSENLTAITTKFSWMIHTSFAVMMLFFHKVSVIFNTVLPTSSTKLYTIVAKFPASTSEHIAKTLSIRCRQQNGVQVVRHLQGQTGGSRTVPDLGCEQDGEEQSITFLRWPHVCASRCEVGHCREGEGPLSCFG
jgi:hypothetical protein